MSGIILHPSVIPSVSVAISLETQRAAADLAARGENFSITGEPTFLAADALFKEIQEFDKALEANRVEVKAPYYDVCTQIDKSAKAVATVLAKAKTVLGAQIKAYQIEENNRREKARQQALRAAQEAEDAAIAAAEAKRRDEIAAAAELPPDERPPEPPVFAPPVVAPVVPAYTPPPLKSSVRSKVDYKLVIDNAALIPREVNGVALLVPDEKAILQLLKMGMAIPGCRRIEINGTSATGRV